jgi:hypothetical protein
MAIWRIEIVGPIPIGSGGGLWGVFVFDENGRKIGSFDAYSEAEAIYIKDELTRRLTGN